MVEILEEGNRGREVLGRHGTERRRERTVGKDKVWKSGENKGKRLPATRVQSERKSGRKSGTHLEVRGDSLQN